MHQLISEIKRKIDEQDNKLMKGLLILLLFLILCSFSVMVL